MSACCFTLCAQRIFCFVTQNLWCCSDTFLHVVVCVNCVYSHQRLPSLAGYWFSISRLLECLSVSDESNEHSGHGPKQSPTVTRIAILKSSPTWQTASKLLHQQLEVEISSHQKKRLLIKHFVLSVVQVQQLPCIVMVNSKFCFRSLKTHSSICHK